MWTEEEINDLQDQTLIDYIKQYRTQYEKDFELIYNTFREYQYDNFFPGISDPANYDKFKKDYYWAFNAAMSRYAQREWLLKMSTCVPGYDIHNHK